MVSHGVVRAWNADEGYGVIDSPETPGGCWAHFSSIVMDGYRSLIPGDQVAFTCEEAKQDGYEYRATQVWPAGARARQASADDPAASTGPRGAYQSSLIIQWHNDRPGHSPRKP
jgi:CspA family cold shock protein